MVIQFPSTHSVYLYVSITVLICFFVINSEPWKWGSSNSVLSRDCLGYSGFCAIPYAFLKKRLLAFWLDCTDFVDQFKKSAVLRILWFSVHTHGIPFHLFRPLITLSMFCSFKHTSLTFFLYIYFSITFNSQYYSFAFLLLKLFLFQSFWC